MRPNGPGVFYQPEQMNFEMVCCLEDAAFGPLKITTHFELS
ncbi:hypothetical protein KL86DES1_10909 [uncultured Desulfovibrio sp.]|uniref:Uncharacterized protein n=1 Tax=uncultured Desulfovibrio sp. TaxID=167968 RepID=A0A212L0S7_9BACT|nr:hypothetical protein KL86DES1_10909 [uncultured Desulfovibrio sp.]